MRKLSVFVVLALVASPAFAQDGSVSQDTLAALGLGDMQVMSDEQGMKVRGMSSNAQSTGLAAFSMLLANPLTGDVIQLGGSNFARGTAENAGVQVASAANVPFVDLFSTSLYLMDEPAGPSLTTNGIHLNSYGYWAMSRMFCDQLISVDNVAGSLPWQLTIDAAARTGESRGVKIFDLSANESGLSFHVTETSFPSLAPPTDAAPPPQLQLSRDTLVVENLKPGTYRLTVDGKPVVTADDKAWSEGVAIDSSPAHKAAEAYRAAVNDKNLQFTYSWKALNQVHIVGERRTSPSGRALPKEVIEFKNLANQRDAALRNGIELKTRQWRVTRVET